jgi:uncharacterized membrane protein YfcA
MWLLLPTGIVGGLAGALTLVWRDERNFVFLVPWLVLFLLEPTLARRRGVEDGPPPLRASGGHWQWSLRWPWPSTAVTLGRA